MYSLIRVADLSDCYWSGGFPLEQDKSFHINMRYICCDFIYVFNYYFRRSFGRSVFIRCEVTQSGATYHIIFSDASDYPPPFKLENLSQVIFLFIIVIECIEQVSVLCYQQDINQQHQYTTLNSGQSGV